MSEPRYAVFFAPAADGALWRFGSSVIGYNAATGHDLSQFIPAGIDAASWKALTAEPRRYGFHATLKAPFRLAWGESEASLIDAMETFAGSSVPFDLFLRVGAIESFVALRPESVPAGLVELEREVVETFERFRAPLNEVEMAKRVAAPLSPRQHEHLARLGYPYVLDQFRFHMTLTGRLPDALKPLVLAALKTEFAVRCRPATRIDRVALFREDDGRFRIVARYLFGG